jgi:hypothetical protein
MAAIHSNIVLRPGESGIAAIHQVRFLGDKIFELWDINQPVPLIPPTGMACSKIGAKI